MEVTLPRPKRRKNATEIDRAVEEYSLKILQGSAKPEDVAEYERLSASRRRNMVKISGQSRRRGG